MSIKILSKGPNSLTYTMSAVLHLITDGYQELSTDGKTTIYGNKHGSRRAITPIDEVPQDKRKKGTFEIMDYFM